MQRYIMAMLAGVLVAGCAVQPIDRQPEPGVEPEVESERRQPEVFDSEAVVALSGDAREAASSGRLDQAAQLLERAIRIEPNNGRLWHELARVRFEQSDYEQARQLAARSNTLLDNGSGLKTRNDDLIEASRNALGY